MARSHLQTAPAGQGEQGQRCMELMNERTLRRRGTGQFLQLDSDRPLPTTRFGGMAARGGAATRLKGEMGGLELYRTLCTARWSCS